MAVTKTINIDVNTKEAVKGLTDLKHEISDIIDETNELNETNQLFKKELAELDQQYKKIPKTALSARKALGEQMEKLNVAIKDNNLALRDFRIKKQQKQKMVSDLNTVHNKTLHTTEGFARLGSVIGDAAVGMLKMAGASEATTHALEGAIHGVEAVEHVTEGAAKAQKIYNTGIKGAIPNFNKLGTKGVKAFSGMTKASKAFAITGIGLVLTAVAALVYVLQEMDDKEKIVEEDRQKRHENELKRYTNELAAKRKAVAAQDEVIDAAAKERDHQVKLLQAEGKSISEAEYEVAIAHMDDIEAKGKAAAKAHNKLGEDTSKMYADLSKEYLHRFDDESAAAFKAEKKLLDQKRIANNKERALLVTKIKTLKKLQLDGFNNIEILEATHQTNKKEKYKKYRDSRIKFARQIQDLENSLLEDGIEKELEINRVRFERLKADAKGNSKEKKKFRALYAKQELEAVQKITDKYQKIADDKQDAADNKEIQEAKELSDKLAEIKEGNAALFRTEQENELLEVERKYDLLEAMAQGNADALADINIARLNAENDINLQYANEAAANQKALDATTLEDKQELQRLILQGAKDTFTTIGNLAQLFAGESEESQRKAFKIQKAANIANATIDTYASAVAAFRSLAGVPIVGVPLGIAAASAAVTAGMLNIKSISQQEFGGDGGGEPDVPSFDAGAAQAPSFNVVGDSGINQLASLQATPTQAYVVSGEVTTSQALDRNRVENATL